MVSMSDGIGTSIGGIGGIVTAILVVYGAKFGPGRNLTQLHTFRTQVLIKAGRQMRPVQRNTAGGQ